MTDNATQLGRPRDPNVDLRISEAATRLFGRVGWSGFSIEAVAREAGVGKASVYLRWDTKEALLTAALRNGLADIGDVDTGSLRDDLVHLARQMLRLYLGDQREAVQRMTIEAVGIPGVAEHWAALRESQVLAARAMVRRAIRRGDAARSTSTTLLLDSFFGAVMMHTLSVPEHLRPRVVADINRYANRLVDFLLRATREGT